MSNTQQEPEALRLADQLERMSLSTHWDKQAAAELRTANGTQKEHIEIARACAHVIADVYPMEEA